MTMVDQDEEHLRLLSILHYVWGGLTAFGGCIGGIYAIVGGGILTAAAGQGHGGPPAWLGGFMLLIGGFIVLLVIAYSALTILAGRSFARRQHYTLCIVMACIECLSLPLGTALGVFTLIVLSRPSVKQKFGRAAPSSS